MKSKILEKLEQLAYERTTPFCYGCCIDAPTGVCQECHSDDLMRHLAGVGVEWWTSWVIKHIREDELTAVDANEVFEESMRQCYPENTTVGWMRFDTVELMKSQDSISWRITRDEYIDALEQDEEIVSFDGGSNYYLVHEAHFLIGGYITALGWQKSVGKNPKAQILLELFAHKIWKWIPRVLFDRLLKCQPVGLNTITCALVRPRLL